MTIGGTADANIRAVEQGTYDYVLFWGWLRPPPPGQQIERLADRYGVNRSRFFVRPSLGTIFLALNTQRPLFRENPALRRAVNFALHRAEIFGQGYLRGRLTAELLPPSMPGFVEQNIYPLPRPDSGLREGSPRATFAAVEP